MTGSARQFTEAGEAAEAAAERNLLRDSVRSFLARQHDLKRTRNLRNTTPGFDREFWRALAEQGCVGALVPPSNGGLGLVLGDMVAMLEELGPALLPEPLIPVAVGAAQLIAGSENVALAERLLPPLAEGSLLAGLAWQNSNGGPPEDLPSMQAEPEGCGLRLVGVSRFVVPATGVDGYVVAAAQNGAAMLCWVPADAAGLTIALETRVDGSSAAVLTFDRVTVAAENVVARAPAASALIARGADACRIAAAAELLAIGETALRQTLEYLRVREQFDRPIGSFQAVQHRAVNLFVQQELARATLDEAVAALATSDARAAAIAASRAKARAADAASAICREAVQLHGAMGFTDECDIGLYLKRTLVLAAWLGNAASQRRRVAALTEQKAAAADHDVRSGRPLRPRPGDAGPVDWRALGDQEFRLAVRHIFESEYPTDLRNPPRRLRWHECREFYLKLSRIGLLALAWPKAFGGAGLSPQKQLIFMEEQDRWGVARAPDMGITMVGPGLIRYGSSAQQQKFLPPILACEHMWCQGFSEPNAGSDLASLRTEAARDGDDFVISGNKIWTTFAHDATHMFILVRTDKSAKKQLGISLLLVDLKSSGIEIRTIRDIAGHEEFCEVRFDHVRVPAENLLGPLNQGWTVAKTLLSHERIYLGNPRQAQYALKRVEQLAHELGLERDPAFSARLTRLKLDVWDLATLYKRYADIVRRGEPLGPDVSILKLFGAETYQRLSELAIEAIGDAGGLSGDVELGNSRQNVMSLFMNSRPATIYGGSSEVQRNILAKDVLHLPRG